MEIFSIPHPVATVGIIFSVYVEQSFFLCFDNPELRPLMFYILLLTCHTLRDGGLQAEFLKEWDKRE